MVETGWRHGGDMVVAGCSLPGGVPVKTRIDAVEASGALGGGFALQPSPEKSRCYRQRWEDEGEALIPAGRTQAHSLFHVFYGPLMLITDETHNESAKCLFTMCFYRPLTALS